MKTSQQRMLQRPPQARKEVGPGISLHIVLVHSLTLDPSESIEFPLQNKRSYQSSEDKRYQILKSKNAEGKGHLKEAHWCAEDVTWFLSQDTPIFVFEVVHLAMVTLNFVLICASKMTQCQEWLCTSKIYKT